MVDALVVAKVFKGVSISFDASIADEAICSSDVVVAGGLIDLAAPWDKVSSEPTHVIGRCALEVIGVNSDDTDSDEYTV